MFELCELHVVFDFMCPEGHTLQGNEVDAGREVACPECGTMLVIPEPLASPTDVPYVPPIRDAEQFPSTTRQPGARFDFLDEGEADDVGPSGQQSDPVPDIQSGEHAFHSSGGGQLLTIPCPNGHLLETEEEYVGEEVACPDCGVAFVLTKTNSLQYQRKMELKQVALDHKVGQKWLMWSVVAAAAVVILLIFLIALSS